MSRQVTIDYSSIAIDAESNCDLAQSTLCQIDERIDLINKTSSNLVTSKLQEYENELLGSKQKLNNQIAALKDSLQKYKTMSATHVDNEGFDFQNYQQFKNSVETQIFDLRKLVNELTGTRFVVLNELINAEIGKIAESTTFSSSVLNSNIIEAINKIEDVVERSLVYNLMLENPTKTFDQLLRLAEEKENEILENNKNIYIEKITKNLQVSEFEKQNNISDLSKKSAEELNVIANDVVIDETKRKKSLNIILKAIRARGFVIDKNKHIKIDRNKNVVKVLALKPNGQRAEFEIQLNGKFMYHFEGYEGQACSKDITPFIEDLKRVYDINILHEEVNWSNPDKIQTQKYQAMNTNKAKN